MRLGGCCANEAMTWGVVDQSRVCMTFSLSCDGGFSFACRCILYGFLDLKGDFLRSALLLKNGAHTVFFFLWALRFSFLFCQNLRFLVLSEVYQYVSCCFFLFSFFSSGIELSNGKKHDLTSF